MENNKKLTRSNNDRMIAGVCGGLGKHFELDPILFRIAFVLLAFMQGTGILLYIILALVIPAESEISPENRETGKEPPSGPSLAMSDMAHQVASITAPISAQVAKIEKTSGGGRYILGILIVMGGVFLLIEQFIPLSKMVNWNIIGAFAVILIGLYIISKK